MAIAIRILQPADADLLTRLAPGVFDKTVDLKRTAEFLSDPRHHLAVAIDNDQIIGFISAVDYIHPDKPRELWINELAVAPSHQAQGIGKQLLRAILDLARKLGCREAWVLTDRDNPRAMRLYSSLAGVEPPRDQVMFTFKLAPPPPPQSQT
jgi:ribosomal protein S18 acetylase RimI-like enzyme